MKRLSKKDKKEIESLSTFQELRQWQRDKFGDSFSKEMLSKCKNAESYFKDLKISRWVDQYNKRREETNKVIRILNESILNTLPVGAKITKQDGYLTKAIQENKTILDLKAKGIYFYQNHSWLCVRGPQIKDIDILKLNGTDKLEYLTPKTESPLNLDEQKEKVEQIVFFMEESKKKLDELKNGLNDEFYRAMRSCQTPYFSHIRY